MIDPEGVVEIWLTSEDTGAYGRDIGVSLPELLWKLVEVIPEGARLRLGMTNPPYILEHLEVLFYLNILKVIVEETLEFVLQRCVLDDCVFPTNCYCTGDGQGAESSTGVFIPTCASTVWFRQCAHGYEERILPGGF